MDRRSLAGGGLVVAGLFGYLAGVYVPYPGRALSLTAIMVGIVLVLIGDTARREGEP